MHVCYGVSRKISSKNGRNWRARRAIIFSILEYKKNTWVRPVQGILSLTKKYPLEVINRSCQRALAFDAYEYQIVKNICKSGSYNLPIEVN